MLDPDIRYPLAHQLRPAYGKGRMLCEVGLWGNTVRLDLARLTTTMLEGYEIKSEADTLSRLAKQEQIYSLVLDRATLVSAGRHIDKAAAMLPEWWGITKAFYTEGSVKFSIIREPKDNPGVVAERVAGLLWKDEALSMLHSLGITSGLSRLRLAELHSLIATTVPMPQLKPMVLARLTSRLDWIKRHDPFFFGPFMPRSP